MEFLKKIPAFILILRPKNLVITGTTLYILQYHVIKPLLPGELALDSLTFVLFMTTTLFIVASGNLVNDIFDQKTDKINKPDKTFIPDIIPTKIAWIYYCFLLTAGAIAACYVAWQTNRWYNIWFYPLACVTLFQYAKSWKSSIITGNIIISLMVAVAWGILFYVQISQDNQWVWTDTTLPENRVLLEIFFAYFFFAFFINFIREIIKDLEDMKGDSAAAIQTLPIVKGEKYTLQIVYGLILILVMAITSWFMLSSVIAEYPIRFFYLLFVSGPLLQVFIILKANPSPATYSKASKMIKLVMVFALIALLLIQKKY